MLTQNQLEALKILQDMTPKTKLPEHEKKLVAALMADCLLNAELNQAVRSHLRQQNLPEQPHVDIFSVALNSRGWEKFNVIYDKFSEQFAKINQEGRLTEEQPLQIILTNYAVIRGAARLLNDFNHLQEKGLLKDHPELIELHQKVKKCHEMVDVLDKKFISAQSSKSGLFDHDQRPNAYFQSLVTTFNPTDKSGQTFRRS